MKIKIKEIPTKKIEGVEYVCEECVYTSDDKEDALFHHGANHAEADVLMLREQEFYLFLDKFDFDCWIKVEGPFPGKSEEWSGPGWYCAYMSDNDYNPTLKRAESVITKWRGSMDQFIEDINKLTEVSSKNKKHGCKGCSGESQNHSCCKANK